MSKSQETFRKREQEKKKLQKRKEKAQRKEERKANAGNKSFEEMLAYVDENGNVTDTPPDPSKKKAVKESEISLEAGNKGGTGGPSGQQRGRVAFYNASKGYGFIKDEKWGADIFFHSTSANFEVKENDIVTFETQPGPKGQTAVKVQKAG